jgi:hypothetical protein
MPYALYPVGLRDLFLFLEVLHAGPTSMHHAGHGWQQRDSLITKLQLAQHAVCCPGTCHSNACKVAKQLEAPCAG